MNINEKIINNALEKRRVPPRMGALPYPRSIERSYQNDLLEISNEVTRQIEMLVLPILPSVARDLGQPTIKKDAGVSDVVTALEQVRKNLDRKYTDQELATMAKRKGMSVAEFNRLATEKQYKRVLGVDLFTTNAPLVQSVSIFTVQNVSLSKSLMTDAVAKVESKILSGFQTGLRWEEIAKDIQKFIDPNVGGVANRAKLIARDQISKLNGQVTQERQKSLGVSKYVWRTSLDERVRDSHRELEGKVFSWDDPPEVGNPGDDFQCRCTAEPVLSEFFE